MDGDTIEFLEIFDFCYRMDMNGGAKNDLWRYQGCAPEHPTSKTGHVWPSPPVELDEENLFLKTASGRLYKIMSFDGDRQTILDQVKSDIAKGGFERH